MFFDFNLEKRIHFHEVGKFQAPGPEWMHYRRRLWDFEMILVTEGNVYISDGEKEYAAEKGEFLIMPPSLSQFGTRPSGCSFYWLHFGFREVRSGREGEEYGLVAGPDLTSENRSPDHLLIPHKERLAAPERIVVLLKQLQDCEMRYHETILLDSLTLSVLAEAANQCANLLKISPPFSGEQLYSDICDFIRYHAAENMAVHQISDYFGYSQKYLTTFFRKHGGCSLKQYQLVCKIEIAKGELTDSNLNVSQIACNVGFPDAHNFSNAFKKIVGLSPTEYRNCFTRRSINH